MPFETTSLYAKNALAKRAAGERLTQNETQRVARLDGYARGYRPLGVAVNQLDDRIHTIDGGGSPLAGVTVGVVRGSDGKIINVVGALGGGTLYPTILKVLSGGNSITLDATVLSRSLSLKTIQVCDAGVTKSMDVIGSATY